MYSNIFLVLASGSKSRLSLLKDANIEPDLIISPDVDETPIQNELPYIYCQRIAESKLKTSVNKLKKTKLSTNTYIIISADTTVACGNKLLNKSYDKEKIRENLELISGRQHNLFTAVCCGLIKNEKLKELREEIVTSTLKFRFTSGEIRALVESKQCEGTAGSYPLMGLVNKYLQFMTGSYSNIIGLPLYETSQMLASLGYDAINKKILEKNKYVFSETKQ